LSDVYSELAERVGAPESPLLRQIFSRLLETREAEMLLALPQPVEELAARFEMTPAEVEAKLDEFVRKGVAIPSRKGGVFCVRDLVQFHDASVHAVACQRFEPVPDDLMELWQRWRETDWPESARDEKLVGPMRSRVLPLHGAVKDRADLPSHDDLRTIIDSAARLGVVQCPCRAHRVQRGECDKPVEVCLQLRDGAVQYVLDRGTGREISREEALRILERAEEAGLVPTSNEDTSDVRFLCFCCADCCMFVRPTLMHGVNLVVKGGFRACVEPEACTGCQDCVERCQFEAIAMQPQAGSKKLKAHVDTGKCWGCGACVVKCGPNAIRFERIVP